MRSMKWSVRKKFPTVKQISPKELAETLEEGKETVVLLDVRLEEEFNVSHLAGARHVDPLTAPQDVWKTIGEPDQRLVVCYCSLGYRSSKMAQELKEVKPDAKVVNLEGSVFQWVMEKRPLVNQEGQAVTVVHPYNAVFGMYVDSEYRYQP